jgi:hypothetical protein
VQPPARQFLPSLTVLTTEYDQIYATRKDRVEAVWPVAARGHSQ